MITPLATQFPGPIFSILILLSPAPLHSYHQWFAGCNLIGERVVRDNDFVSFLLALRFLPVLFLLSVDLILAGLCVHCVCVVRGLTTIPFTCFFYLLWGLARLRSLKTWFTLCFRTYLRFPGELLPLVVATTLELFVLTTLTTIHSHGVSIVLDTVLI